MEACTCIYKVCKYTYTCNKNTFTHVFNATLPEESFRRVTGMQTMWNRWVARFFLETLGIWTASSLTVLREIAAHTTLCSGLSVSFTSCNLLQQLSVKLWSCNAKMIPLTIAYSGQPSLGGHAHIMCCSVF